MATLIDDIVKNNLSAQIDGKWVISRPEGGYGGVGIFARIKDAWGVLIGKFDAIRFYKMFICWI